jgi:hypothetical protein
MTSRPPKISDDAVLHLRYELDAIGVYFARVGKDHRDWDERNAYLEAGLLHVRQLVEFLITSDFEWSKGGRGRDDDLRRSHFHPDKDWTPKPADAVERLTLGQSAIHKYLAHLTRARVDDDGAEWNYSTLPNDLLDVAAEWVKLLEKHDKEMAASIRASIDRSRCELVAAVDTGKTEVEMVTTTGSGPPSGSARSTFGSFPTDLPVGFGSKDSRGAYRDRLAGDPFQG